MAGVFTYIAIAFGVVAVLGVLALEGELKIK